MRAGEKFRLARAYGESLLSYAVDGPPRPFSASFSVTDRCNLRCEYCNFPNLETRDLKLDAVIRLFDRLRLMGVQRLGLVGGEPMIRKDLPQIIAEARQRHFFVTVNTNLTLYDRFPHALDEADHVFTSLDGDPSTHEANRGEGSLDGVVAAIRSLVRSGKPVTAICVVRHGDGPMARRLLGQARDLGIDIHFQPQCTGAELVRGDLPADTTNDQLRAFWRELGRLKAEGHPVASSAGYLDALADWHDFRVSAVYDPSVRCAAGRGFLFVDPEGNASPCAYVRGRTRPVNLLSAEWSEWDRTTPCTSCSVGPMLEFNRLFQHPVRSVLAAMTTYVR
jgi:MoaA/NifB/PqqE/SkfB family radical SAM enzyme